MRKWKIIGILAVVAMCYPVVAEACSPSHNATVLINDWLAGDNSRGAISANGGGGKLVRNKTGLAAVDGGGHSRFGQDNTNKRTHQVTLTTNRDFLTRWHAYYLGGVNSYGYDGYKTGGKDHTRATWVINWIKDWFSSNFVGSPTLKNVDKSNDSFSG